MTPKEKLYKEYVIKKNKLNSLLGEALIGGNDIEGYFDSHAFRQRANTFTKNGLNDMLDTIDYMYKEELEKKNTAEYYQTEDGKARKERLLGAIKLLENSRNELREHFEGEVEFFIKEWLGDDWGVECVGLSSMNIGLVDEADGGLKFGHEFTLYYDNSFRERFEMNYGTMGGFSLLSDDGLMRRKCLWGMAVFANDKYRLEGLQKMVKDFLLQVSNIDKELDRLNRELNHPLDKKWEANVRSY